jgi:hypothetical protein
MSGWRVFTLAFLGRVAGSLFVSFCVALGFGPDEWTRYLMSGLPAVIVITPGIVRLVFLVLASLTLFALSWQTVIQKTATLAATAAILVRSAVAAAICVPFIAGLFTVDIAPIPPLLI